MMSSPRITYAPCPDVTVEAEVSVLAAIYKLAISSSHARKEAAPESRPDDARKDQDARTSPHCT
jgi:hypothetical protein